jgi:hypothetical protein
MDYRGVLLLGGVASAAVLASATACSGPDPGTITFAERQSSTAGDPPPTSSGSTSGTAPVDTGPKDPIFKTVMKWEDPGVTANAANAAHGGTVEGKDCIVAGCHLDNGKQWLFAGTVYSATQGGTTVAKAEIQILGPDNTELGHTYTDANGNFWLEKVATIPANSKVGVRKEGGTRTSVMVTPLQPTDKGCNANRANCHGTATTGKVYVQ